MLLQACLNGPRQPSEHPPLPVTADELAADAAAAFGAGAGALHIHAKGPSGAATIDAAYVDPAVRAIRAAVPDVPVGVTTGAWAASSPTDRILAVRGWTELPDFASVNWHEPGSEDLADLLLDRGVGVEAGIRSAAAARQWREWARGRECIRVLLEVIDVGSEPATAEQLLAAVGDDHDVPVLLHGEGPTCWPVFDRGAQLGTRLRIGLEDTLTLPDGSPATDNQSLVETATRRTKPRTQPGE